MIYFVLYFAMLPVCASYIQTARPLDDYHRVYGVQIVACLLWFLVIPFEIVMVNLDTRRRVKRYGHKFIWGGWA